VCSILEELFDRTPQKTRSCREAPIKDVLIIGFVLNGCSPVVHSKHLFRALSRYNISNNADAFSAKPCEEKILIYP